MRPCNFTEMKADHSRVKDFIIAVKKTYELFPNDGFSFTPEDWLVKAMTYL